MQFGTSCSLNHDTTMSFGSTLPHLHRHNSLRFHPYAQPQHMNVLKHFIYLQYGCGMQFGTSCSLNHDTTTSFGSTLPHLHRHNSLRFHPYAQPQHMNVLKHFIYLQYGCWMQFGTSCSLNHDTTTSFGSTLPHLHRHNSLRFYPCAHPQHMKVLKHFIYIYIGCWMQSAGACSLNHDTTTSFGSTLPQFNKNKFPGLHCTSMGIIV
jgi:hypothetical protein